MNFRSWITEPRLRDVNVEGPERIKYHCEILSKKYIMREVFAEFYHLCMALDQRFFGDTPGKRVELGAGVSMFKTYYPGIFVTDVVPAEHLDDVLDAQRMSFEDNSIRSLIGLNCFHHFNEPENFFREALRVLHPGGGCILLDPYYGPLACQVYRRLHATESFDKTVRDWSSSSSGIMTGANQALSYIVFKRDRELFLKRFPDFEIVYAKPVGNYLRYLLSGGLNFRQLVPNALNHFLKLLERVLIPFSGIFALHHIIVLKKILRDP